MTSVHQRSDVRVFYKMCTSLASVGINVSLIVSDGKGDDVVNNVKIIDVCSITKSRIKRMSRTVIYLYYKALEVDAEIYHLHDPELIPLGLLLRRRGKIVIFDSHEDYANEILSKQYIPILAIKLVSKAYQVFEKYAAKRFSAVIAATPKIKEVFELHNAKHIIVINNYPLLCELLYSESYGSKEIDAVFTGSISSVRGVYELVSSLEYSETRSLSIAGTFSDLSIKNNIESLPTWSRVKFHGQVKRGEVIELLAKSRVGVVTYLPAPNHIDSQPNKLFEYMGAGIPVVASDFPHWRKLVEENKCGLCVNPSDPKAINDAIDHFVKNPSIAAEIGSNGQQAVINKYNWNTEKEKLTNLYIFLLEDKEKNKVM